MSDIKCLKYAWTEIERHPCTIMKRSIIVIVVKGPIFYSGDYFISVNHITSKHQFFLLQLGLITNWVTVT